MATSQLQMTMAALRISLAEIRNKESQLDHLIAQFRTQLRRLPRQVVYGRTSLDASLAAMGEIEERLADALVTRRRLLAIKKTATQELESLEVVKQVDEARRSLSTLRQQRSAGILPETNDGGRDARTPPDAATEAEIKRLEKFIAEYSKRAELIITASYEEREELG